jgi:hypothetical protein
MLTKYPGYFWLVDRGLVGRGAFTALQPWYFVPDREMRDAAEIWPDAPRTAPMMMFARRQDCDDVACFRIGPKDEAEVVVIEGWTGGGRSYDIVQEYPSFWEWLKSVIDDVAFWSSLSQRDN